MSSLAKVLPSFNPDNRKLYAWAQNRVQTARDFYVGTLGFEKTAGWHGQALFVSAGRYHHHSTTTAASAMAMLPTHAQIQ